MKYCIIIPDGMADYPIENSAAGRLSKRREPRTRIFSLKNGQLGVARTIHGGFPPGSDVANLTIVGYNPRNTIQAVHP